MAGTANTGATGFPQQLRAGSQGTGCSSASPHPSSAAGDAPILLPILLPIPGCGRDAEGIASPGSYKDRPLRGASAWDGWERGEMVQGMLRGGGTTEVIKEQTAGG